MSNEQNLIICVEDDAALLEFYHDTLRASGYRVLLADCGLSAVDQIRENYTSLLGVVCDQKLPDILGTEVRRRTQSDCPDIPFIIVSATVTRDLAISALDLKISAFVEKPVNARELIQMVQKETKLRLEYLEEKRALKRTFLEEANSLLTDVEPLILSLEDDGQNPNIINSIFRLVHTVKGSSSVLDDERFSRFAHKLEDLISSIKNAELVVNSGLINRLLKSLDILKGLITGSKVYGDEIFDIFSIGDSLQIENSIIPSNRPSKSGDSTARSNPKDSLEVPTAMLDEVMSLGGEITVIRNMVNKLVRSIEKSVSGNRDVALLAELLEEMHKINGTIQTKIVDLRKVPIKNVFRALPRTVRDLSASLKKEISVKVLGDAIRVDTTLAQALANSIVHLVRNAADHGIENADERIKYSKSSRGLISINCIENSDNIVVEISDDGKGIDPETIRAKALERGLYTSEQLNEMAQGRLLEIIFEPGFSTAAKVTDVSGRGVGLDMVKSSVEAVGGEIEIHSTQHVGTKFVLNLPVPKSILIINSLLIEVGGNTLAIPQDSIGRVLMLGRIEIKEQVSLIAGDTGAEYVLNLGNQLIPIVDLAKFLQLQDGTPKDLLKMEQLDLVVVESGGSQAAFLVGQVLDSEEIVVKTLHPSIAQLGIYGGATFMGDGRIGMILGIEGIFDILKLHSPSKLTKTEKPGDPVSVSEEFLLFNLRHPGKYAISLGDVFRLEDIPQNKFSTFGNTKTLLYRDSIIPIIDIASVLDVQNSKHQSRSDLGPVDTISLIIVEHHKRLFGFEIAAIIDVRSSASVLLQVPKAMTGVKGVLVLDQETFTVVSPGALIESMGFVELSHRNASNIDNLVTLPTVTAEPIPDRVPLVSGEIDFSKGYGFFE